MSTANESPSTFTDVARDIYLWRKKKLSLSVLAAATVTWVILEVYHFNFITVASWLAMSIVASMFIWGNMARLVGKEAPSLSGLEVSEQAAMETANAFRVWMEEGIRWMFRVGAEKEWFVFFEVVAGLWVLSLVGSLFDLLTLLYIGIVLGMTVPPVYVKYEDKIKEYGERIKMQGRRWYDTVDEKVIRKIKHKVVAKKEKKDE